MVILSDFGACKKNVLCKTLTPLLGAEMRSKKINGHQYQYQTGFEGESEKNNRFVPRELLF